MALDLQIIRFAARECELQGSGEMSVAWMLNAWDFAQYVTRKGGSLTQSIVLHLGALIEPRKNARGFRTCPVSIGHDLLDNQRVVPHQIETLVVNQDFMKPAEFFKEFETIHPFVDGNGRTGAILYNWLNGSLDNPVWPPNFWNDPRRTLGNGA
jgi:hypothetical protein